MPKKLINLNDLGASGELPYLCGTGALIPGDSGHICWIMDLTFLLFNPSVVLLKVILQVSLLVVRLLEEDLEVLTGLLHRAASQCNTLLPPSEGESAHHQCDPREREVLELESCGVH